jgi:hypothetical protein
VASSFITSKSKSYDANPKAKTATLVRSLPRANLARGWNKRRATYLFLFFPLPSASCSSTLLRSSFTSERVALRKPV